MSGAEFQFSCLIDPRLAAHALSPTPVWLWSTDATCVLWSNPTAAAIFDAASPAKLSAVRFKPTHAAAAQIVRLAGTLPQGGAPRLERLRGYGANLGGTLICLCSRIALADNSAAILVVSTERAGKDLSLPDRAQRLLTDMDRPSAIFTADGELIEAVPAARQRLGDKRDLIALGAEKLAREASLNGRAEGEIAAGPITMLRLGAGATVTLLVAFNASAQSERCWCARGRCTHRLRLFPPRQECRRAAFRSVLSGRWMRQTASHSARKNSQRCWGRKRLPHSTAHGRRSPPRSSSIRKAPWRTRLPRATTWSGIIVHWPVENSNEPLPIEMSGLPVFDRDRQFTGYRGFGICRDVDRLAALAQRPTQAAPVEAKSQEPANNVLAFAPPPAEETPALSPVERSAFQEIGRELSDRLKKTVGKKRRRASAGRFRRRASRTGGSPAARRAQRR